MKKSLAILVLMLGGAVLKAQVPAYMTEVGMAIEDQRAIVNAGGSPQSAAAVIQQLELAYDGAENANAAVWGIDSLNGWGYPAPVFTDPGAYATQQLAAAQSALTKASGLTTDPATLNAIRNAQSYLRLISTESRTPPENIDRILWSLYSAEHYLAAEGVGTVQDLVTSPTPGPLVDGLWYGIDYLRSQIAVAWGLATLQSGWPMPANTGVANGAIDCGVSPNQCAGQILLFAGISSSSTNQTHGLPYFFQKEMHYFSLGQMTAADGYNTLNTHPVAWKFTDDAGYRLLMLDLGVVLP